MQIEKLLKGKYPDEIVDHLIATYKEVERGYRISSWKVSELDAGHFVEAVRRLIEYSLLGKYTSFSEPIRSFSGAVLQDYEKAGGHVSYRILIPRVAYSLYCIRNKRGVGHIAEVTPNEMDATYVLYSVKWIFCEIIRLSADVSTKDAEMMLHNIVERQVEAIWEDEETFMILNEKMKAPGKVLLALYKRDNIQDKELQRLVEYRNYSDFKKILRKLKEARKIDVTIDGRCKLSPIGVIAAEGLIKLSA